MEDMTVVASAPGKVLLTGAYLVLERPNAGLVLSTSARFFAIVKPIYPDVSEDSWAWSWADVKILSPQLSKETTYKLSLRDFKLQQVAPGSGAGNSFVEKALQLAMVAAHLSFKNTERHEHFKKLLLQGLQITILGSNDFYSYRKHIESHGLPLTSQTLSSLHQFAPITFNSSHESNTNSMLPEVAKTGLGSSAAMTSAVVAAILHYTGMVQLHCSDKLSQESRLQDLETVHSISQAAHSLAQGKIGSGFDVSAAVFGSQRYVRFSPSILSSVQEGSQFMSLPEVVSNLVKQAWDSERQEYALPPFLQLIVGEPGFGGSHTPSMVGAIQKWRRAQQHDAERLWSQLGQANLDVERGLLQLKKIAKYHTNEYKDALEACSKAKSEQWKEIGTKNEAHLQVIEALLATRHAFQNVRSLLRQVGEAAHVPVEPPPQTTLLDATMSLEGVLIAGVPGAGGYDAVFSVTLGKLARDSVENEWSKHRVLALCVHEDPHGVQLENDDPRQKLVTKKMDIMSLRE